MKNDHFIFYGWLIVIAGIFVYSLGYGARYSFSVIFPSLLEEFNWPRDTTAAMLSFHILVYGFVAPVAGSLVDRIGPRKTMSLGVLLLASGLVLSGYGREPWHFYLSFGALSGAGLCLIGAVSFTTVVKNWFERKRGLALSILFFGAGVAFTLYPAIAYLIERLSWRKTFTLEGIIVTGIMLPIIIIVVRYHPSDKGLLPDGDSQLKFAAQSNEGKNTGMGNESLLGTEWTLPKAVGTISFWLICLSTFSMWGVGQHLIVAHHVAFAIDLGYSQIYASSILSLFGVFFAIGSLSGFVSDRIGREATMIIATISCISGIIVLLLMRDTSQPWMLYCYAITWGFGNGMTAPTIPASATDIFRGQKIGSILGSFWFSFAMGGAIGPWLGGWIFEKTDSYTIAFLLAIVLYAVACLAIWIAAPRKMREDSNKMAYN